MPRKTRLTAEEIVALYQKLEKKERERFWQLIQTDNPAHDDAENFRRARELANILAATSTPDVPGLVLVTDMDEVRRQLWVLSEKEKARLKLLSRRRNEERDSLVINDRARGLTTGQLAAKYKMRPDAVKKVLKRKSVRDS